MLIAAAKAVGGPFAHCPALLSEAARLLAHSLNEVFLLAALALAVRVDDLRGVRRR
ncbi:hypothetical protein [Streptomyces sp. MK5]|uniref:hypothetical protein n=1 Tax=Streptomyces sp. MK5 TaxID=3064253 RepID=UPI0035577509